MRTILILFTSVAALLAVFFLIVAAGLHRLRASRREADRQWAQRDQVVRIPPPIASQPTTQTAVDDDPLSPHVVPPLQPIVLLAIDGKIHGQGMWGGDGTIEHWKSPAAYVEWRIPPAAPADYRIELIYSLGVEPARAFTLFAAGQTISANVRCTKDWNQFVSLEVGTIKLDGSDAVLRIQPNSAPNDQPFMRLRQVCLVPPGMTARDPSKEQIVLLPSNAELHGQHIKLSTGADSRIMNWTLPTDWAEWTLRAPMSKNYRVMLTLSNADSTGGDFSLTINREVYHCHAGSTGNFDTPKRVPLGKMSMPGGRVDITIKPDGEFRNALMNLWSVEFEPE